MPSARPTSTRSKKGRILVTGGAGFIGSALVWELNRRGTNNIIIADYLKTDEKWKNLTPLKFVDYVEADKLRQWVRSEDSHLAEFSTVYHLGACSATTEKDASYLIDNNYEFTKELAQWALSKEVRFVYASSAATYGDGSHGMSDSDAGLEALRPLNMYGYSKHLFDLFARREGILDQMVGLKYFNVYGPNEWHKGDMRSMVCKGYEQIVQTGKIKLFKSYHPDYADGGQMRDFHYVKDAVAMTIALAENNMAGGLYNIGSGEAHTWVELATAIFEALGQKPEIEFVEMPDVLRSKYQYYTKANISKLRESGYSQPVTPFKECVRDYVQNYLIPGVHLGDAPAHQQ